MAKDPNEVITITHDGVKADGQCTRRQLERVWKAKGWKEKPEAKSASSSSKEGS